MRTTKITVAVLLAVVLAACGADNEVVEPEPLSRIDVFDDPDPKPATTPQGDPTVGADDPFCIAARENDAARLASGGGGVGSNTNSREVMDKALASMTELRAHAPNEDVGVAIDTMAAAFTTVSQLGLPENMNDLQTDAYSNEEAATIVVEMLVAIYSAEFIAATRTYVEALNANCGYQLAAPPMDLALTDAEISRLRSASWMELNQLLGS